MFFLEFSCFFNDPTDAGNLISGSSAFSKSSLNIWKFSVHVLLKPILENFEHYFASVWDKGNCTVLWTFFGIAFFGDWDENRPFPVLWPLLSFPNLLAYWVQHFQQYCSLNCTHSNPRHSLFFRLNPVHVRPATINTWGLEGGIDQQAPKNESCRLIPRKWSTAAAATSSQSRIWGRISSKCGDTNYARGKKPRD